MKTVITKKIDGYDIVISTHDAGGLIDAEATKVIVEREIVKCDACKKIDAIKSQMQVYANQAMQAKRNSSNAKTKPDKIKLYDEFKARWFQFEEEQKKLMPLYIELKAEYKRLMIEHAIYFNNILEEGIAETIIEDAEAESINKKLLELTQFQLLCRDGSIVDNHVGIVYWKKTGSMWEKFQALKIGDVPPSGSVPENLLDDAQRAEISEQLEKERVAALKSTDKAKEKAAIDASLVSRAAQLKNEYEITGESKPLEKAQAWLADERAKLELKYA